MRVGDAVPPPTHFRLDDSAPPPPSPTRMGAPKPPAPARRARERGCGGVAGAARVQIVRSILSSAAVAAKRRGERDWSGWREQLMCAHGRIGNRTRALCTKMWTAFARAARLVDLGSNMCATVQTRVLSRRCPVLLSSRCK
eukprot:2733589-Prymnesium_polylepis.1